MNEDSGILGKTLLGLIVAGIVFAWVFPIVFVVLAPKDRPFREIASALNLPWIESPPERIMGRQVHWEIAEAAWLELGGEWRGRIGARVVPGQPQPRLASTETLRDLCEAVLKHRPGTPWAMPEEAAIYRLDLTYFGEAEPLGSPLKVTITDGVCALEGREPSLFPTYPGSLRGWKLERYMSQSLPEAEAQTLFPDLAANGFVLRRVALFIRRAPEPDEDGDIPELPPFDFALACAGILQEQDDAHPFSLGPADGPPEQILRDRVEIATILIGNEFGSRDQQSRVMMIEDGDTCVMPEEAVE